LLARHVRRALPDAVGSGVEADTMKTAQITLDQKFLEVLGTGSLIGRLAVDYDLAQLTEVELRFPQTTLEWRRKHGGPDSYIIPEFAIACLLEDVLNLLRRGVQISVSEDLCLNSEGYGK